jgi:tetratricopeptide (TPR) repeat protein
MRGYLEEAQEWLTTLLARNTSTLSASRAGAIVSAGSIAWRRGDYPAARQFYEQAKEYYLANNDLSGLAGAVSGLANVAWYQGDHAAAEPLYEETLRLARQNGDPARIGVSLNNLGLVANANQDWEKASRLFEECLTLRRKLGDRRGSRPLWVIWAAHSPVRPP